MSQENNPTWLKPVLEFGPIVAFFVGYMFLKDKTFMIGGREYEGFILITAGFVPLIILATFLSWKLTGHISKMQIMTAVLVTVFGGLTVWLNDDRFIKMKPTLIYVIFGSILAFGLLRGQSYVKVMMGELMPMTDEGWMILTRRLTAFFFGLAILNEAIWRSMSTESWVYFKTFGLTAAIFVFFISQSGMMARYAIEDKSGD